MNLKKLNTHLVLGISTFILLTILLGIQVLFMVKASKVEARNFNHRAVMALKASRDEIGRAAKTCNNMNNYVCGHKCSREVKSVNFNKVDSIIKSNLKIHKIDLDYTFELNDNDNSNRTINMSCYEQSLNGILEKNGIKLLIEFPDTTKFVYAQMGSLFYISITCIILLMISFIITYRMFRKEKIASKNTAFFIDNMIHEFHTPIANIKFASNLIKKVIPITDNEKVHKYIKLIQNENNKMECHVGDIQNITKIEANQTTIININSVLEQCAKNFIVPVENESGKLNLQLLAQEDQIKADEHLIKLVISNLIDNAIKYNDKKPNIKVKTTNTDKHVHISVSDNGIGIPTKELNSIFLKYYRVPTGNIHNAKGFGLGLAFVKEVVLKHNGQIKVSNNKKEGVTFTLTFNIAKI